MKVYLAHPISTTGEFNDSKRVANEIRQLGYEVYAAAENLAINDKSNDPTPRDIYDGDVSEIMDCNVFVVNLTGGLQDGTISEVGFVSGYNEANKSNPIKIIGYTSNTRLQKPQFYKSIPSSHANHLVLGMIEKWGEFAGDEKKMLEILSGDMNDCEEKQGELVK